MLGYISNYIFAAIAAAAAILLLVRSSFPPLTLPMDLGSEYDEKTLRLKVTALSLAVSDCRGKGAPPSLTALEKELKRFAKTAAKRLKSGETLEDYELTVYETFGAAEAALSDVKKHLPSFYALPHCGKYPRVYSLCLLLVGAFGGYIGRDEMKKAVDLFDRRAPLNIAEVRALPYALRICLLEKLAALCGESRSDLGLVRRAEKDAANEKIDLTCLKYGAYLYTYRKRAERALLRRFSAICLENGIDADARCDEYLKKISRFASIAKGAAQCLHEEREWLDEEFLVSVYPFAGQASAACSDFSGLSAADKLTVFSAFGRYRKRALRGGENASPKASAAQIADVAAPSAKSLALTAVAAFSLFVLPIALLPFVFSWRILPLVLAALPILSFAAVRALRQITFARIEPYALKGGAGSGSQHEFAFDYAESAGYALPYYEQSAKRHRQRLQAYTQTVLKAERALYLISPIFALALVFIGSLVSPLWLIAAFFPQICAFIYAAGYALAHGESAVKAASQAVSEALFLPETAAKNIMSVLKADLPSFAATAVQLASAAILAVAAVLFRASAAVYVVAAAFAIAPAYAAAKSKMQKKREKTPKTEVVPQMSRLQRTHGSLGAYPRVCFLTGGDFICHAADNGRQSDYFRGERIGRDMKIYTGDLGGEKPLKFVPPFVTEVGRAINNAVGGGYTHAVETVGYLEGGKAVTIEAHGGADLPYLVKYALIGAFKEVDRTRFHVIVSKEENNAVLYFAAATTLGQPLMSAVCETEFEEGCLITLSARSSGGRARFVFIADYDLASLESKLSAVTREGCHTRSSAGAAVAVRSLNVTPSICDVASFVIFGRCRYENASLGRYLDLNYNTVLCYMRGDSVTDRLYDRLKKLAVLKKLGLSFNVAVIGFFAPVRFAEIENRVRAVFEEYALNKNGNAVCIDCERNGEIYEKLVRACPEADEIRFIGVKSNPPVRSYKRAALLLEKPRLIGGDAHCGTDARGNGVYDGFGVGANAENRITDADGFGFIIRSDGRGFTFADDPFAGKLTSESAAIDALPSEVMLFSESGRVFGATPLPKGEKGEILCCHYPDKTVFRCVSNGLDIRQEAYLASGRRTKIWAAEISNPRAHSRSVTVLMCVRPALGESEDFGRGTVKAFVTKCGVAAKNTVSGKSLYLVCDGKETAYSLGEEAITDESGGICEIEHISNEGVRQTLILSCKVKIEKFSNARVRFALSDADGFDFICDGGDRKKSALGGLSVMTGDKKTDLFVESLQLKAAASLYCPADMHRAYVGGGESFVSPLINGAALLPTRSAVYRRIILDACKKHFLSGEILVFKAGNKGVKKSDASALFLPMAAARYIDSIDDKDILYERASYLDMRHGGSCYPSAHKDSVLSHCLKILLNTDTESAESVLGIDGGLLLIRAVTKFLPLVRNPEERLRLTCIRREAESRLEAIDANDLTAASLAWSVITKVKNISLQQLKERAEFAGVLDRLWICAALLERGESEYAFGLLDKMNPIRENGDICAPLDSTLAPPLCEIAPAVARLLMTEGFFGCTVRGGCLRFSPRLPKQIKRASVRYDDGKTAFDVNIDTSGEGDFAVFSDGICYNSAGVEISEKLCGRTLELKRRL